MPLSGKSKSRSLNSEDSFQQEEVVRGVNDTLFSAFMSTVMGENNETNSDNYYMDGLYMDSFKFSSLNKEISVSAERAVYAVSTGIGSDRASKLVLRFLNEKRKWLLESSNISMLKNRLRRTIYFCNQELIEASLSENENYRASLAVAVYYGGNIVYAINGGAGIGLLRKRGMKLFESRPEYLGNKSMQSMGLSMANVKKIPFDSSDRLMLLSDGAMKQLIHGKMYTGPVMKDTQEMVTQIAEDAAAGENDVTCIAVEALLPKEIRPSTIAIAMVCLMWIVLNIALAFVIK